MNTYLDPLEINIRDAARKLAVSPSTFARHFGIAVRSIDCSCFIMGFLLMFFVIFVRMVLGESV